MTYPQRKTCPACDAPVLLVASSRRGGTPMAFDPDPRTGGEYFDTRLADDLSHVAVAAAATAHLQGHVALYRSHLWSCALGLRVPAGRACPSWAGYSQAAAGPKPPAELPSWPEPWEGIEGTVRDGSDLLSLRKTAMPRRRVMIQMAANGYKATLAGSLPVFVAQMGKRIRNPQPGDLVAEIGSARDPGSERKGFGILIACRREWLQCGEDWKGGSDGRPSGDVWYVQYGPRAQDVARWTDDAQLITAHPAEAS